jgi:peptidyl-prolyl cis-trans isomerase B (cyclophilin B)
VDSLKKEYLEMSNVKLETSLGNILIELEDEKTPETTKNFLEYVRAGFYDNTLFHRVIKGFMVQGGGFDQEMLQKSTRATILNEAKDGLKNEIGTIAMARTSAPHSASSQFFINVANNDFLNFKSETPNGFGYCAFGRVVEGLEVVKEISLVATGSRAGHDDVPIENILIIKATEV